MDKDIKSSSIIKGISNTALLGGIVILLLSLYILYSYDLKKPEARSDSSSYDISIGGRFDLIDHNNKAFSSEELKGKLSLIYFGFTYCPDICPASLEKITKAIRILNKYQIHITPVFITVDPNRDTTNLLKEYLSHFDGQWIGLTGSSDQIKEVAKLYKAYYSISNGSSSKIDRSLEQKIPSGYKEDQSLSGNPAGTDYLVDHTAFVYLLDENGKYVKHFYFSSTTDEIVNFIMQYKKAVR